MKYFYLIPLSEGRYYKSDHPSEIVKTKRCSLQVRGIPSGNVCNDSTQVVVPCPNMLLSDSAKVYYCRPDGPWKMMFCLCSVRTCWLFLQQLSLICKTSQCPSGSWQFTMVTGLWLPPGLDQVRNVGVQPLIPRWDLSADGTHVDHKISQQKFSKL